MTIIAAILEDGRGLSCNTTIIIPPGDESKSKICEFGNRINVCLTQNYVFPIKYST